MLVLLLGRFERPGRKTSIPAGGAGAAAVAVSLVGVGICGFAASGLVDLDHPNGRLLIALPVSPLINIVALGLGGLTFLWSRRGAARAEAARDPDQSNG